MPDEEGGFVDLGRIGQPAVVRLLDSGSPLTLDDLIETKVVDLGK